MTLRLAGESSRNRPCPCGSGKKFKRCCGAQTSAKAPPNLEQELRAATALLQSGNAPAALAICRVLHARHPKNPLAAYLSGYAALENGRPDEAIQSILASIELGLSDAAAYYHLGRAYLARGGYQAAVAAFGQALAARSDFDEARLALANCQFEVGQFVEAASGYRALLARTPDAPQLLYNLAHAGFQSGDMSGAEAASMLERALLGNPDNADIHAALALVLETDNRLDQAEASARRACALAAKSPSGTLALARILIRRGRYEDALQAIAVIGSGGSPAERIGLCAARGQALEKLARHDEAMAEYRNAKLLQSALTQERFDAAAFAKELERQRQFFSAPQIERLGLTTAPSTTTPVFIVGFYRCGSSLLEQMLSMHPAVQACGERKTLGDIEVAFGAAYPECLSDGPAAMRMERLAAAARTYFEKLPVTPRQSVPRLVVDKELMNLLRLPLIRLLFPNARIVHVLRHPLDSAISALSQVFAGSAPWAASLSDIARFYALAWEHLHATRSLPGINYLPVRYEDLVGAPELTLKRVSEFIGADWDPAMLEFHESRRQVRTASYAQVTRPLYRDSVERFRSFLPYIEPEVLSVMKPVVFGMGYTL